MSKVQFCRPGCCGEQPQMRMNLMDGLIEWHRAGYRSVVPYNATAGEIQAAAAALDEYLETL